MILKINSLIFALLCVLFYSCSDDNEDDKFIQPSSFPLTLEYQYKYRIVDFKVYVGSPEGGRDISAKFANPEKLWGDYLIRYDCPYNIIFRSKDSISHLPHRVDMDDYKYKWRKKSLFAYNSGMNDWELYGFATGAFFEYAIYYYKISLVDEPFFLHKIGQGHGVTDSDYCFNLTAVNSPKKMIDLRDTIAWCNVRYIYK